MSLLRSVFRVLLVLWAGSLWSLAAWVAPTLFRAQSDRHLAGVLAGRLFSIETYVGMSVLLLSLALPQRGRFKWGYVAGGLLAVDQWTLRPVMDLAHARGSMAGLSFGAWHGVSGVIYLAACAAVLAVIWNGGDLFAGRLRSVSPE